jgi:elongation factor G
LEKGVREQLQNGGPLGGYKYPVTDVKITLVDGKMHSVDSKDITCQPAGLWASLNKTSLSRKEKSTEQSFLSHGLFTFIKL